VEFGLYDGCPSDSGELIPGTSGSQVLEDNGAHVVVLDYTGDPLTLPSMVWLAVEFDRTGPGWFVGTDPEVGYSDNVYDYPTMPCLATLGGTNYYAGFAARLYCHPPTPPVVAEPDPPNGAINVWTNLILRWNGSSRVAATAAPGDGTDPETNKTDPKFAGDD
jgi:hypothetical protein